MNTSVRLRSLCHCMVDNISITSGPADKKTIKAITEIVMDLIVLMGIILVLMEPCNGCDGKPPMVLLVKKPLEFELFFIRRATVNFADMNFNKRP